MDSQRKKLIFRSWHRGTKEMDIILGRFAHDYIPTCPDESLAAYEALLTENDPDLYNWITGREAAPDRLQDNAPLQSLIAQNQ